MFKSILLKIKQSYLSFSEVFKASLFFSLIGGFQQVVNIIITPFLTYFFTQNEYGIYTIYTTWYGFLTILITLNIPIAIMNTSFIKFSNSKLELMATYNLFIKFIGFVITIIFLIFNKIIIKFTGLSFELVIFLIIQVTSNVPFLIWTSFQRFHFKYKNYSIVVIISVFIQTTLTIILVSVFENNLYARIFSILIVQLIISTIYDFLILKNFSINFFLTHLRFMIPLIFPLFFHYIFQFFLTQIDKIFISQFYSEYFVALFNIPFLISLGISFFSNGINSVFTPWSYRKISNRNFNNLREVSNNFIYFISFILLILSIFGPELINFLGSGKFNDSIKIFTPILLSVFFQFIYSLYANIQYYYHKTYKILLFSITIGIFNILMNYFVILNFSIYFSPFITLISNILLVILHGYSVFHLLNKQKIQVYDFKFFISWSLRTLILAFLISISYNYSLYFRIIVLFGISIIYLSYYFTFYKTIFNYKK